MFIIKILVPSLLLTLGMNALALQHKMYASNNTKIISLDEAYQRLRGEPELDLRQGMIEILQKSHIQQGSFQDILGAYLMSTTGDLTADNTEAFIFSPYQKLSTKKLFRISATIAQQLNQDSVALLEVDDENLNKLPEKNVLFRVRFDEECPLLTEVLAKIKTLPHAYQNAFSIQMKDLKQPFTGAKVSNIEWIGHDFDVGELTLVFPKAKIITEKGFAWLVFKDGHVKDLG